MDKENLLSRTPLFAGLADRELHALAGSLGRRTYNKGMIIFHKDSHGQSMYVIDSGRVRIYLLSEAGQEISVNVYGPGEVFGELALFDGLPRSAGAVALENTVTYTLHRKDFLRHLEDSPGMAQSIIQVLSRRLRYTTTYVEGLSFLDVHGRVAAKLLELADRYGVEAQKGAGIEIDLHLSQAELATWVGATRESVNKVLGAYRDQCFIDIDGQRVRVLDRQGLERRARY